MPSSSSRPASHRSGTPTATIDKLEYKPGGRPLLRADHDRSRSPSARPSTTSPSYAGSFFEQVVEGVMDKDRAKMTREATRYFAFAWAIVNCLCAGSITAYSLYAPLFQKRLGYTQLQVNGVSITAELAMYLPVPLFGVLCDRYGPGPPSLLAGIFFGVGYVLAAFAYSSGPPASAGGDGWPYAIMVLAFIPIGMGTSCMYLSAVTTCAKNFGRGKYKGIALALPIAAFGLSGMWQSQIGSRILYEKLPDGSKGPVDVYRFFVFLGTLFLAVGVIGGFVLRVVGEEELIDEAVEELERSGLLEESEFFRRRAIGEHYGTMSSSHSLSDEEIDELQRKAAEHAAQLEEEQRKKNWLLNAETRYFLADHTMWWLAAGFFLVTGPGEAFINNLGTIIDTFYHPSDLPEGGNPTNATTHVSIVAVTSTLARIVTGTLTDFLAPTAPQHQHRRGPHSLENSMASLPPRDTEPSRFQLSRVTFLLAFALLCSLGQILLATGVIQEHAERFWLVSACIGAGYGATFSLTPIVVSVVWGVENFGTNWGIVATVPAIGATVWGLAFAGVYQRAAGGGSPVDGAGDVMCYGKMCYLPTFWAMAVSVWVACGLWFWAWRGKGGWISRGVLV
jgi:MFS family permease